MLCSVRFHPIMCSRHHCRYCGGIFCRDCSKGRSLVPARVCDVCFVRLESVQPYLMDQVIPAAQLPTHELTDLRTLRSWVNFPWGQSMEYEIYKATNTIRGYITKIGSSRTERLIPDAILRQAKGLAVITVAIVGVMVTYKIGTRFVVARRDDVSWSPPSAISSFGLGWGAQGRVEQNGTRDSTVKILWETVDGMIAVKVGSCPRGGISQKSFEWVIWPVKMKLWWTYFTGIG